MVTSRYIDDGLDVGTFEDLELYQRIAAQEYIKFGMVFKLCKSELVVNKDFDICTLSHGFKDFVILSERAEILGVPIGDAKYCEEYGIAKIF